MKQLIAAAILLVLAAPATAQAQPLSYVCEVSNGKDTLNMTFMLVEGMAKGMYKAYVIGDAGTEQVLILTDTDRQVVMLETTESGNAMLTTILKETGEMVHSRHYTSSFGSMIPSQYVGKCEEK